MNCAAQISKWGAKIAPRFRTSFPSQAAIAQFQSWRMAFFLPVELIRLYVKPAIDFEVLSVPRAADVPSDRIVGDLGVALCFPIKLTNWEEA
jgi:hypothetical protein